MLDNIRQGIGSFFVKIFLGLIIVSFAVWGIGDIFRSSSATDVASVGDSTISLNDFLGEFRRTMSNLQARSGGNFSQEQALALGYDQFVLGSLVSREVVRQDTERLGILIGDERIAREILKDPNFQDEFGSFSRFAFDRVLSVYGYTEDGFIQDEKVRMAGDQIRSSLAAGQMVPESLARELFRYRLQKRVADLIILPNNAVQVTSDPTFSQLQEYYGAHLSEFTTPEQRSFSYISLTPQDFIEEVQISEEELAEEYEFRLASYTVEPKRDFLQMVFNSSEDADAAHQALLGGEDFAAVAQEQLGLSTDDISFRDVEGPNLPAAIAEDILSLTVGQTSDPLETDFGWYIVRVTAATDGSAESFADVRDELIERLTRDRAIGVMASTANEVDDALAGGASLARISDQFGLEVHVMGPITTMGFGISSSSDIIASLNQMVPAVFDSYEGAEAELVLTDDNEYYMLEVDLVEPPSILPFEEVSLQATASWRTSERIRLAEEKALKILELVKSGASFLDITANEPVQLQVSALLNRGGTSGDRNVDPLLRDQIFNAEIGELVAGISQDGTSQVIAQLRRIDAPIMSGPEDSDGKNPFGRWQSSLDDAWQSGLLDTYEQGLHQDFSVSIYPNVLALAFETPTY